jgi:hypothetical protein
MLAPEVGEIDLSGEPDIILPPELMEVDDVALEAPDDDLGEVELDLDYQAAGTMRGFMATPAALSIPLTMPPLNSATEFLRQLGSMKGWHEDPKRPNVTPFWAELYPQGQGWAWCMAFQQWGLIHSGAPVHYVGKAQAAIPASAPYHCFTVESFVRRARMAGMRWLSPATRSRPGDLVIFKFSHVGAVLRDTGDVLVVREGNTSPGNRGSQADGGGVYDRTRRRSLVRGFMRPPFGAPSPTGGKYLAIDGKLNAGTVRILQGYLNKVRREVRAWPVLDVDGEIGPQTTRALQSWLGVDADGEFGPLSARAAERELGARETTVPGWHPGIIRALQRHLNAQVKAGAIR